MGETGEAIRGRCVELLPSRPSDRNAIYRWLCESDLTAQVLGPPRYPEVPVPSQEEFFDWYPAHFFDGSTPLSGRFYIIRVNGESVGVVGHNELELYGGERRMEFDVWMRSLADCGQEYGPDAIDALCRHLSRTLDIQAFMVQPSRRNPGAIRAYERAGFKATSIPPDGPRDGWGPSDYSDGIVMVRRLI